MWTPSVDLVGGTPLACYLVENLWKNMTEIKLKLAKEVLVHILTTRTLVTG